MCKRKPKNEDDYWKPNRHTLHSRQQRRRLLLKTRRGLDQWQSDYLLVDCPERCLHWEYLEMVLQYGFVTLFVSAFPLAPLFALLNNVIEIRLDAYKFTATYKRPISEKGVDLGIWLTILDMISRFAVLTNVGASLIIHEVYGTLCVYAGVRDSVHIRFRAEDVVQMGVQQRWHTEWICRLLTVLLCVELARSERVRHECRGILPVGTSRCTH
jgi:hypothetical protein